MSDSPLQIFQLTISESGGKIGITQCPGLQEKFNFVTITSRNLESDLKIIFEWKPEIVVTLMEQEELEKWGVEDLGSTIQSYKIRWLHLPIQNMSIPNAKFEANWLQTGPMIRSALMSGKNVLIHCRGGLGRSGMIAARILVDSGWPIDLAIKTVRAVRPGAIETKEQEQAVAKGVETANPLKT